MAAAAAAEATRAESARSAETGEGVTAAAVSAAAVAATAVEDWGVVDWEAAMGTRGGYTTPIWSDATDIVCRRIAPFDESSGAVTADRANRTTCCNPPG